jgi:hypothetical protein
LTHWTEDEVVVKIKRFRLTKNHLKSIYFSALMVGAVCAPGLHAFAHASTGETKFSLAFKSCKAIFYFRPYTDVFFHATTGNLLKEMIVRIRSTQLRFHEFIPVTVSDANGKLVAEIHMELSLRVKRQSLSTFFLYCP